MPENTDLSHKLAKELGEKIQDNLKLIEESLTNSYGINSSEPVIAAHHSHQLLKEAKNALTYNNKEEAAHQLRREVDFCNKLPEMIGSVYEKTGKAGLKALAEQKSSLEIIREMEGTWQKSWTDDPKALSDRI